MTTTHDPLDFVCGDTWELSGPLLDVDGNPLALAGASITWRLDSVDGAVNVLARSSVADDGIVVLDLAAATILVTVTAALTAALPAGTYSDWLRVVLADGSVFTEWTGVIRAARVPA